MELSTGQLIITLLWFLNIEMLRLVKESEIFSFPVSIQLW